MTHGYQLAAGSTIGRDHRRTVRNNQDGFAILDDGEVFVAVVTDGCGSGARSEVGSQFGARLIAESIRDVYLSPRGLEWSLAERRILSHMDLMIRAMGGDYIATVKDYFLFTTIGVIADAQRTTFFIIGDGLIMVNGEVALQPKYEGNEPPYIAYALLPEEKVAIDFDTLHLRPALSLPTDEVRSFLIGSDGTDDLVRNEEKTRPGLPVPVGSISQFWEGDKFFANKVLVTRELGLLGRDWPHVNPVPGILTDDTTLIVGRRIPDTESE